MQAFGWPLAEGRLDGGWCGLGTNLIVPENRSKIEILKVK